MTFWEDKTIIVTGGEGFLGKAVVKKLKEMTTKKIIVPTHKEYDLRKKEDIIRLFDDNPSVEIVIHLAAVVGGIGLNKEKPGTLFYDNLMMGVQLMEEARLRNIEKFVAIGTICAYPKNTPVPFKEKDLWIGYPEETNAPYGLAKKMLLVQSQAYRQEHGFNSIFLLPVNLYGPNDNFDPKSSHVIPALIKKICDAKKENKEFIEIWGTGKASREFLYVDDCAEGILLATEKYNDSDPINIGAGFEITIKELVEKICKLMDYDKEIHWDTSKPDGQPRRCLDVSKAKEKFGFEAKMSFDEGLKKTINWYENYEKNKD